MYLNSQQALEFARCLSYALPSIAAIKDRLVVVKYGGNAMTDESLKIEFARDAAVLQALGVQLIIVHGGGPQIGEELKRLGKIPKFVCGMHVTDKVSVDAVDRILGVEVNQEIVELINSQGGRAFGINGRDGLVTAKKLYIDESGSKVDLGYVGDVSFIDEVSIKLALSAADIPVIAPLGRGIDKVIYNVNADLVASSVAQTIKADLLVLLTNTQGLLDLNGNLIRCLAANSVEELVETGVIHGGMLPKIKSALDAVANGVGRVKIADGRTPKCLIIEVLTKLGTGTTVVA
tara:strand:- start:192 stop:1064 length:873 start_codon:yes stop_codon:yes gene_type:complete